MKRYVDIEEFTTIDELLDHAEWLHGPGTFVVVGRMGKRNVGAFDADVATNGEVVIWPGDIEATSQRQLATAGYLK